MLSLKGFFKVIQYLFDLTSRALNLFVKSATLLDRIDCGTRKSKKGEWINGSPLKPRNHKPNHR